MICYGLTLLYMDPVSDKSNECRTKSEVITTRKSFLKPSLPGPETFSANKIWSVERIYESGKRSGRGLSLVAAVELGAG